MPGDEDELGAGLDDFETLVNSVGTDEVPAPLPPDAAPVELAPPPGAAAEAKPKRSRKTAEAKPVPLKEPGAEDDEPGLDSLPESTRLEMEAGRAALARLAGR